MVRISGIAEDLLCFGDTSVLSHKTAPGTGTVGEGNREKPSPSSSSKARTFEMGLIQLQLENG